MKPRLPWDAWMLAALVAAVAGALWIWDHALTARASSTATDASASAVRERFPMPASFHPPDEEASVLLRAAAETNPFSPQRGQPPPAVSVPGAGASGMSAPPPAPIFVLKGIVAMGSVRRAILEDASAKKTYFLQVGQEVAGFKVLDIDESRVILSDLNTQKQMVVSRSPTTGP